MLTLIIIILAAKDNNCLLFIKIIYIRFLKINIFIINEKYQRDHEK